MMLSKLSPTLRAALALLGFSGWLAALFWGVLLGGAIHLLLPLAAVLFPWRSLGPTATS
jgi:membrane protein required for beta-lactamase induction